MLVEANIHYKEWLFGVPGSIFFDFGCPEGVLKGGLVCESLQEATNEERHVALDLYVSDRGSSSNNQRKTCGYS